MQARVRGARAPKPTVHPHDHRSAPSVLRGSFARTTINVRLRPPPLLPPPYHRDQHGIEGAALTLFWVLMSPPAWMMIWAMSRQLCQAARCSAVSLRKTNPPGGGHVDQRFRATNPELNPDHQKTRQRKATATARRRQGSVCEKKKKKKTQQKFAETLAQCLPCVGRQGPRPRRRENDLIRDWRVIPDMQWSRQANAALTLCWDRRRSGLRRRRARA